MPFITLPIADVKEPKAVAEGEYELRIIDAEDTESKKGNPMTVVKIALEQHPDAYPIRHYITYPSDDTPPDQINMRVLDIKRFLTCFGVAFEGNGFNTEDLVGQTGRCMVTQEDGDDGNVYNRLRLPRLKE